MLNLNPPKPIKCKHCGKERGKHKADTNACPFGRGSHPSFRKDQFYEPRSVRALYRKA